jgi:anaerobic ribonucleoside-triphosphate reductase activating protein
MNDHVMRLHAFVPYSRANGPGIRAVLWVQGCSLGCPGCYNPETHPAGDGSLIPVDSLFAWIARLADTIEGISVSGGEPLQQRPALIELLRRVRNETRLSVLVFTGYTWEEVQRMQGADELLGGIDVLIAGRYDQRRRLAHALRGSANKTVHYLTKRYTQDEIGSTPTTEVIIRPDGEAVTTGIDALQQ